jgi:hypothetical protein
VLWGLWGQPTCEDCYNLADKDPDDFIPTCENPKRDYECHSGYWEYGRLYPENELAWSVHKRLKLLGAGGLELLGLKKELGPVEMERLIDRMMIIEDTVNRYNEEKNKPDNKNKPRSGGKVKK